ncbi:MAG: PadR family transcriptional regulator [Clostridia bacterium]|nr:PadR family transcriptional regulator [Clostridia bacterium]
MVRVFILYYLNMKATHGYEIQRFFQLSGMEQWMKIQSGSIYYALTKLEKEGLIYVVREESTGTRVRKIFGITTEGKQALEREMLESLEVPIFEVGSSKFVLYLMTGILKKNDAAKRISHHIEQLKEQKEMWVKWRDIKLEPESTKLEIITFDMTIQNIDNQILWHEEFLKNLDLYMKQSHIYKNVINEFNFDDSKASQEGDQIAKQQLEYALQIKQTLEKDPQNAIQSLEQIIEELKQKV